MTISSRIGLHAAAGALLSAALLTACGGGGSSTPSPPTQAAQPATPAATELTLTSSASGAIAGGAALTLNASLNGAGSINWALAAGSPGALSATTGASVSYTPPASFTGVTAVTISATSGSLSKNMVLSLTPNGPGLTLLAGTISPGTAVIDGRGAAARFYAITALATDSSGNLYVADASNTIRKVSADGTVSTLNIDWSGLTPGSINAVTPMADGSVYLSDAQFTVIDHTTVPSATSFRKLGANGRVTTLATVNGGWHLIAAADGTLYADDTRAIYTLRSDGSRLLLAGDSSASAPADVDGTGAAARFNRITQFRVAPDGSLVVLDANGLRQVSQAGVVATLLPNNDDGAGAVDLSLDQQGNPLLLYTVKTGKMYEIRQVSAGKANVLYTLDTSAGPDYQHPQLLLGAVDGAVITTDGVSLSRTATNGKTAVLAGVRNDSDDSPADGQGAQARLGRVDSMAADSEGNLYVRDQSISNTYTFRKITPQGAVTTVAALPAGLGAISDGNVYQTDLTRTTVVRLAPDGTRSVVAGIENSGKATNLPGPLPALLYDVQAVTPLGGKLLAVAAGHGIYTLVLP
jgi:sugar lactone lactonase YvrE